MSSKGEGKSTKNFDDIAYRRKYFRTAMSLLTLEQNYGDGHEAKDCAAWVRERFDRWYDYANVYVTEEMVVSPNLSLLIRAFVGDHANWFKDSMLDTHSARCMEKLKERIFKDFSRDLMEATQMFGFKNRLLIVWLMECFTCDYTRQFSEEDFTKVLKALRQIVECFALMVETNTSQNDVSDERAFETSSLWKRVRNEFWSHKQQFDEYFGHSNQPFLYKPSAVLWAVIIRMSVPEKNPLHLSESQFTQIMGMLTKAYRYRDAADSWSASYKKEFCDRLEILEHTFRSRMKSEVDFFVYDGNVFGKTMWSGFDEKLCVNYFMMVQEFRKHSQKPELEECQTLDSSQGKRLKSEKKAKSPSPSYSGGNANAERVRSDAVFDGQRIAESKSVENSDESEILTATAYAPSSSSTNVNDKYCGGSYEETEAAVQSIEFINTQVANANYLDQFVTEDDNISQPVVDQNDAIINSLSNDTRNENCFAENEIHLVSSDSESEFEEEIKMPPPRNSNKASKSSMKNKVSEVVCSKPEEDDDNSDSDNSYYSSSSSSSSSEEEDDDDDKNDDDDDDGTNRRQIQHNVKHTRIVAKTVEKPTSAKHDKNDDDDDDDGTNRRQIQHNVKHTRIVAKTVEKPTSAKPTGKPLMIFDQEKRQYRRNNENEKPLKRSNSNEEHVETVCPPHKKQAVGENAPTYAPSKTQVPTVLGDEANNIQVRHMKDFLEQLKQQQGTNDKESTGRLVAAITKMKEVVAPTKDELKKMQHKLDVLTNMTTSLLNGRALVCANPICGKNGKDFNKFLGQLDLVMKTVPNGNNKVNFCLPKFEDVDPNHQFYGYWQKLQGFNIDCEDAKLLKFITPQEFMYYLTWMPMYSQELAAMNCEKYEKTEEELEEEGLKCINYDIDTRIVSIHNRLVEAAKNSPELMSWAEMAAVRIVALVLELTGGSTKRRIRENIAYRKIIKGPTEVMRQIAADKTICICCKKERVKYGPMIVSERKLVAKYCQSCFLNETEPFMEDLAKENLTKADLYVVSFSGHSITVSKTRNILSGAEENKESSTGLPSAFDIKGGSKGLLNLLQISRNFTPKTPLYTPQFEDYETKPEDEESSPRKHNAGQSVSGCSTSQQNDEFVVPEVPAKKETKRRVYTKRQSRNCSAFCRSASQYRINTSIYYIAHSDLNDFRLTKTLLNLN